MSDQAPIPDPRAQAIDLQEAMQRGAEDQFWAVRGHAIQAYANLEQALCRLFAMLSGMDDRTAAIIFFRITSTNARNAIIEKLFQAKFLNRFNLFRNTLIKALGPIDRSRNEIAHWSVANRISRDESGNVMVQVTMHPPTFMTTGLSSLPERNTADLVGFMTKCSFYSKLITMFHFVLDDRPTAVRDLPEADVKTWLDIFLQPITYPPPEGHPLSPNLPELYTPH